MKELPILEEVAFGGSEAGFGALSTPNGNLPLKSLTVRTRIMGLLAHMVLQQSFVNSLREPIEATYIFPLPNRSAVTSFLMEVGDRRIEGELEERSKARQEYQEAIQAGHRAAMAEEERPNVFTIQVGNLMPGDEARVKLELAMPLMVDDGEVTYRFPLVVAPRYIPGWPLDMEPVGEGVIGDTDQVPDASRITPPILLPGFPNPVRLELEVEIDLAGLPIDNLSSSLHSILTEEDGNTLRIRLNPGERLSRDFILRYSIADHQLGARAIVAPDSEGARQGTLAVILTAPRADRSTAKPCGICARPIWQHERLEDRGGQARAGQID